ncbi:MAG: DUF3109 family protein [Cytophagales bacterium]|nr:DUF3109 family protein [Bernardetiaceae bacterium]MDW8203982.1 DUF3109 family protein [Cytophagales bacterium]
MLVVQQTILSDDIAEKFFVCHLEKCKGACCVEGDSGAPLLADELPILEQIFESIKPFLTPQGIATIEKQGAYVIDQEGDYTTPLQPNGICAYAVSNEKGILKCGIEQAYLAGTTTFRKPLSCHLYPIRVSKYGDYDALNYHRWHICSSACALGSQLGVPLYVFLKDALVRAYGEEWYTALEQAIEERIKNNNTETN